MSGPDEKYCKHCKKSVKTSLNCEICDSAFHPSCARQAKVAYQLDNKQESVNCCVVNMDEKKLKSVFRDLLTEFLGPFKKGIDKEFAELKKSSQQLTDCVKEQKNSIEATLLEIKQLRDDNTELKKQIDAVKSRMSSYESDVTTLMGPCQNIDSLAYEIGERSKRSRNLMIYNIPQSDSSVLKERIDSDEKHVAGLLTTLGLSEEKHSILKMVRVGKMTDQKVRPLKLVCSSTDAVMKILRNSKKLQSSNIKISRDLTKQQQGTHKKVRAEYNDRKAKGEDVVLKYSNGMPVIEVSGRPTKGKQKNM